MPNAFSFVAAGLTAADGKTTVPIIIIRTQFFRLEIATHIPFFAAMESSRRAIMCGMIPIALINPAKYKDDKFYK